MSLPQIRDEFRVPARIGARVTYRYNDRLSGVITGSRGDEIECLADDGYRFCLDADALIFHDTLRDTP